MKNLPPILLVIWLITALWSAINPANWTVWWAEMIPVLLIVFGFAFTYHRFKFSHTAYAFAFVWLIMHTIGAHYTFEFVPFDWFTNFFGFERNHYDRLAHFAIGFYAVPFAEIILNKKIVQKFTTAFFFAVFFIMSLAAAYEILEWQFAVIFGGDEAQSFLGSQGDYWDAQKDMLADTLGAITSLCLYKIIKKTIF
ncbi:hypothetical protein CSB37_04220 [bacterium DOLZORAL124_38_8]|nr:MAG: hypothetical protein CSB37_04220 [bacterium DOLZORAL124_38_8]